MIEFTHYIEKKYAGTDLCQIDPTSIDVIVSTKQNLMGVALGDELLMLNVKHFFSFRCKLQNVGYLRPLILLKYPHLIDKDYLRMYFDQNQDNPYAIQNAMNNISCGKASADLTQFPPLIIKKESNESKMAQVHEKAQLGDCIFTFDRSSGISRLIRKYDIGMWSHVGIIDKDKRIVEMTTSGFLATDFSSLCRTKLDVGLYRLKDIQFSQTDKEKIQIKLEEFLRGQIQFDWKGIFLVFLHKKFGIPIKHAPTPADLIYSNKFELIAYA